MTGFSFTGGKGNQRSAMQVIGDCKAMEQRMNVLMWKTVKTSRRV
jgi:hypothetical protein